MTIIDVSTLGKWADPERSKLSIEYCEKYCTTIKIELVCNDENVNKFMELIQKNAHTWQKGDGKIFISSVEDAVRIRTGEAGEKAV